MTHIPQFAAVVVYDEECHKPTFCIVAHNLVRYDADRLAVRLKKQYELDAHVILHNQRHEGEPPNCQSCGGMFEDIIRDAEPEQGLIGASTLVIE